ncbi:MAG: transposase [Paracoccaceae bacterium]|nr:transposase [Paracoccaceae bacterium]MDW3225313.1 transposase [Paracoccaceae bacterium]
MSDLCRRHAGQNAGTRHRKDRDRAIMAYGRDERPWGSDVPPASWYQISPDRKGQHPKDHLAKYHGWMHADGYAGFEDLYRSGDIREVACMAHVPSHRFAAQTTAGQRDVSSWTSTALRVRQSQMKP